MKRFHLSFNVETRRRTSCGSRDLASNSGPTSPKKTYTGANWDIFIGLQMLSMLSTAHFINYMPSKRGVRAMIQLVSQRCK